VQLNGQRVDLPGQLRVGPEFQLLLVQHLEDLSICPYTDREVVEGPVAGLDGVLAAGFGMVVWGAPAQSTGWRVGLLAAVPAAASVGLVRPPLMHFQGRDRRPVDGLAPAGTSRRRRGKRRADTGWTGLIHQGPDRPWAVASLAAG
jgi:hypothetical protein